MAKGRLLRNRVAMLFTNYKHEIFRPLNCCWTCRPRKNMLGPVPHEWHLYHRNIIHPLRQFICERYSGGLIEIDSELVSEGVNPI